MKLFSIRDSAAGVYMQIWTSQTTGTAIRGFQEEVNNRESPLNKHPTDFELFEMGTFDNETGAVVINTPRSIARATDYHTGVQTIEANTQTPR